MTASADALAGSTLDGVPLEERLLRRYREQLRHYDRVAAWDERGLTDGVPADNNWVHDLHAVLADVAALDAVMADDKEAWRRSGQRPSPELAALLERLAERIAGLAARVNRHAADLEAHRNRLVPELDELIQNRRMLQAYGQYGERQAHARKPS
jgi:hypothetical protein